MDQINAIVDCDVSRLNAPLRTWRAVRGFGFVALLRRVPADVTGVSVRVYSVEAAQGVQAVYADCAGVERADGGWLVRCPSSAFPNSGELHYAAAGVASDGEPCALGRGRLVVE